eukprot:gb/GEZN01015921.1/.p1 GENE.gb/GEZN01015921.1/~~gb/GEZN01015921.1/.p1  ORF type:complete len:149 (-),score=11.42 gb/GEZN01015921.1/:394-840(-)
MVSIDICAANTLIALFSLFRFVVYAIPQGLEHATQVKIDEKHWQNEAVREVAFKWTKAIRLFSFSRVMFAACVVLGGHEKTNQIHLVFSLLLDIYLWINLVSGAFTDGKAVKHRGGARVPTGIQTALTLTELVVVVMLLAGKDSRLIT